MHPGNIFVDNTDPSDPHYIAIDFGIVGTLNSQDKRYLAENFIAFFNRDYRKVAELPLTQAGSLTIPTLMNLKSIFAVSLEPIFEKPLQRYHLLCYTTVQYRSSLQYDCAATTCPLQKTLLYIEDWDASYIRS